MTRPRLPCSASCASTAGSASIPTPPAAAYAEGAGDDPSPPSSPELRLPPLPPRPHALAMFVVTETDAAAIRAAFDRGGDYRPPSSCAGYSPASPAPRRRESAPALSPAGSRCLRRYGVSDCRVPGRGVRAARHPLPRRGARADTAANAVAAPCPPPSRRPVGVQHTRRHGGRTLPAGNSPTSSCAGGQWEPGSRRWLVEPRRIGPVIRVLEQMTDPLFRVAGHLIGRSYANDPPNPSVSAGFLRLLRRDHVL